MKKDESKVRLPAISLFRKIAAAFFCVLFLFLFFFLYCALDLENPMSIIGRIITLLFSLLSFHILTSYCLSTVIFSEKEVIYFGFFVYKKVPHSEILSVKKYLSPYPSLLMTERNGQTIVVPDNKRMRQALIRFGYTIEETRK